MREIASSDDSLRKRLCALVHLEFQAAREHSQEFLYFCENEARFLRDMRRNIPRVRQELIKMIRRGQKRWRRTFGGSGNVGRHAERRALRGGDFGD